MAPKPRHFDTTWTPTFAYAMGLMTTDGNLSPDGRHLELTSKDFEQVERFKGLLGLTNRISKKNNGRGELFWRIQFGSVVLYQWMLGIGLNPNKSKILGIIQVPNSFFFDFLRGHMDGDGMFQVYDDPAFPNSRRLYTTFHSASLLHLEWIQSTIKLLLNLNGYINSGVRIWRLTYAKGESLKLLPEMYHSPEVPCLSRKRSQVAEFLGAC